MNNAKNPRLGIAMMLIASLLFSTGGLLCKIIPWSPLSVNGVRSIFGTAVFLVYIKATGHKIRLNRSVFFGALFVVGMSTFYITANKLTTAANTIVLQYSAPIWIILYMALFFHVRPKKKDLITLAVVFAGILFFFLDSLSSGNQLGNLCAVLSGMFYGGVFILNQFEDGDSVSSLVIGLAISAVCMSPFALQETNFEPKTLLAVLILGVFQVGIAYVCFCIGTLHTAPITAALINGIEPVLNPIIVAVFWGELITPLSLVGAVIVFTAILAYQLAGARSST